MTDATASEAIAKPEDLSYDVARDAHRWNSFTPERRARQCQEEYAADVNGLHAEMLGRCRMRLQER